jgi:hypothetical protein
MKKRGEWSWKRLWCWLDGHGGIAWDAGQLASNAARPWCKQCGARVKLIG